MIRMIGAVAILCFSPILVVGATPKPYECTIAFIEQEYPYHFRFMNHLGELSDPVFLPDGLEVDTSAYNSLCWSPDGESLAFACRVSNNLDICIIDADGGGMVQVTQHSAADDNPAWSPDGACIAFLSSRDGGDQPDMRDIYIYDFATSMETRLTTKSGRYSSLAWSPNSDKIAYVQRMRIFEGDEIFILDVGTGGITPAPTVPGPRLIQGLQWSPSEDKFLFYAPSLWGSMFTLEITGEEPVDLTAGVVNEIRDHPSWYPCGQVLHVRIDASEQIQICKMRDPETGVTPIGTVPCFPWSPRYRFITGALPNLIVSSLSVGECSSADQCIVSFTIENAGTAASCETTAYVQGIWIAPPPGVNEIRIQKQVIIPQLDPGESHAFEEPFNCNEMFANDVERIRVTADPKVEVSESIETDNVAECDWP